MEASTLVETVSENDRRTIVSVLRNTSVATATQAKTCARVAQAQLTRIEIFRFFDHISETPIKLRERFTSLGVNIFQIQSLPPYLGYPSKLSLLAGTEVVPEEEAVTATDLLIPSVTDVPVRVPFSAFKNVSCIGKDKVTHMRSPLAPFEYDARMRTELALKFGDVNAVTAVTAVNAMVSELQLGYNTYTTLLRMYKHVASPKKNILEVSFIQPWVRSILQFVANTCSAEVDVLKWKDYIELSSLVNTKNGDTIIAGLPDLEIVNRAHASDTVQRDELQAARKKLARPLLSDQQKEIFNDEVVLRSVALRERVLNCVRLRGIAEIKIPRLALKDPNSINENTQDQTSAQLISLQDMSNGETVFALLTDGFSGSIMVLERNSGRGHTFYRTRTARSTEEMLEYFVLATLLNADELLSMLKKDAINIDEDDSTNIAV